MKKLWLWVLGIAIMWPAPAGAKVRLNGGLGYYQPTDPAITGRYGNKSILTFSLGGEIPISKRLSSRVEFELTDTRPDLFGGRVGAPGTRDLATVGGRVGLTGYPFSPGGHGRALYLSAGGTYRHLTEMLWVQSADPTRTDRQDTSYFVLGPYALIGARMSGFSIEARYDWPLLGTGAPYGTAGGLSLSAGFTIPIGM